MGQREFVLRGRLIDEQGAGVPEVTFALVDRDVMDDDLIAVGRPAPDGTFCVSFTTTSFNQEPLEHDTTPRLALTVSMVEDDELKAFHSIQLPRLEFATDEETVGDLVLPLSYGAVGLFLDDPPIPKLAKSARRVELDGEFSEDLVERLEPVVETLTGWPSLGHGLKVILRNLVRRLRHAPGGLAVYDASTDTLYVDDDRMQLQSLDRVKVAIGRELVHRGQCKHHPEVAGHFELLRALRPEGGTHIEADLLRFCANVDGYGAWIERRLEYRFSGSVLLPPAGPLDPAIDDLLDDVEFEGSIPPPDAEVEARRALEAVMGAAAAKGRAAYEALDKGQGTVRFDPALRIDL
ncbi:MAG: hypothetical protein WCI05_10570 [Myxococcales bacterium]